MATLDELFEGEEARRLAKARVEIANEKAAWDALTPAEQAAHIAAVEAKFGDYPEPPEEMADCEDCGEPYDDCICGLDSADLED